LEETNLELADDLHFVSAENNFFTNGTPQRHYVTICLGAHVVDEAALENMEPDKCEGWEWVSAAELLDDKGAYRPLFVPLRHIFVTMGLVKE
jgi:8-oxo-dGTP diphosphatase